MNQLKFWDKASESDNLRNEWLCDENVSDEQCLEAIGKLEGKILDLGCGIGRLTQGYGVDVSPKMLAKAKPGNYYKLGDGRQIPYQDEFFDSVFSILMFQHITDFNKHEYIEETYRVLKSGGIFRLQYVVGKEISTFSHPTSDGYMKAVLEDVGFVIGKTDKGLIYPEWTWITATK